MDLRDWEVVVVALVGLAGIGGTLWATRIANRNARSLMQAQWERDDLLSKRSAGKQAAKEILSEFVAAAKLFDAHHLRERTKAFDKQFGRGTPQWMLGPEKSELDPHYRAIRYRLLEIPDADVAENVRTVANAMWNHMEAVQYSSGVVGVVSLGRTVDAAAERVLSAYIQEKPQPDLSDMADFRRITLAIDAAVQEWEEQAAEAAAIEAAMTPEEHDDEG